ncbi:MAG: DNA cytosine methyltransferase [Acidimicrobiaceae bacterium]|nr:DNA cytosine methyltransferase [Acidimicrobiaceae bacterium]MDE0498575.1 DNA cytosine methyltransferase [Acidimicrobiaceae bacterium]
MNAATETASGTAVELWPDEQTGPVLELHNGRLTRSVRVGQFVHRACIDVDERCDAAMHDSAAIGDDLAGAWWKTLLAGALPDPGAIPSEPRVAVGAGTTRPANHVPPLRTADLFCGIGGLSEGVRIAAAEFGRSVRCELAVDTDASALGVFKRNHHPGKVSSESARALLDYRVRGDGPDAAFVYPPEVLDASFAERCDDIDLVVAGPPCQGHSNLNNHSRRSDRRNHLYLSVAAFAVAVEARAVVIENVTAVIHDASQVVASATALLEAAGYAVETGVLAAHEMGWPQTRKRHFLVACANDECSLDSTATAPARSIGNDPLPLADVTEALRAAESRSVLWAIGGDQPLSGDARLHELPEISGTNRERIAWLFDNEAHDLALTERPKSHRAGTTYGASYGRMHADRPAPTITTGYTTPGRGRFVHPTEPRTISHAEAARLQGFPDSYCFEPSPGRAATSAQLSKWIGNAVTVPLGYAAALSALLPALGQPHPTRQA